MTRILLARHGDNVDGQTNGEGPVVDLGPTERGREQVDRRPCPACAHAGLTQWREAAAAGPWVLDYANDTAHLGPR